jgi:glycerate-2-kinase
VPIEQPGRGRRVALLDRLDDLRVLGDQVGPLREARATGSPWPRGTIAVACGGECTVSLGPDAAALFGQGGRARKPRSLRKGLVDHATTALLEACGDAVLTGATQTNANDLIIIGVS